MDKIVCFERLDYLEIHSKQQDSVWWKIVLRIRDGLLQHLSDFDRALLANMHSKFWFLICMSITGNNNVQYLGVYFNSYSLFLYVAHLS